MSFLIGLALDAGSRGLLEGPSAIRMLVEHATAEGSNYPVDFPFRFTSLLRMPFWRGFRCTFRTRITMILILLEAGAVRSRAGHFAGWSDRLS